MERFGTMKLLIAIVFIVIFSIGFLEVNPAKAQTVYQYNFEPGWDDWGADYGVWQVGSPTAGPDSCHGGEKCAGTVLGGNYPGDTDSHLISPSIMLPGASGDEELHLRFWQWFSYHHYDAGYVQISVYDEAADEWSDWTTIGNSLVNNTPAWSLMGVELTDYANQKVRISFYHTARSGWESTGWYIDDIKIIRKVPEFTGSFESGWGDWSADRGLWEVGTPTAGPDSCHGGSRCAGTVLGGNYPGDTDSRLISPSTMLPGVSGDEELHLRFWHWFSYHHYDAGYVQISVYDEAAGEWSDWTTIGNPVINSSSVWSPSPLFELTDYANKKVRIAFYHTARSGWESTGWYIDDVRIPTKSTKKAEIIGTWDSGIWYWNPATSRWKLMTDWVTTGDIAAGDINGDGKADVASCWPGYGLYYQNGATLGWQRISTYIPSNVAVGDLTGDGKAEVIGTFDNGIWYWNPATASWKRLTGWVTTGDIAAGDITGDGKADVASCWPGYGLYYQNGATYDWQLISTYIPSNVAVGDLTGDGKAEVIGTFDNGIWYWNPVTASWKRLTGSGYVTDGDIAAGDFTGDGHVDTVSCWSDGLWMVDGKTGAWTKVYDTAPYRVTAGDITGK